MSEKSKSDKSAKMKSAYELALERLEGEGVERPRGLTEEVREKIAGVRQKAEAELAQVEILHKNRLKQMGDPEERRRENEDYLLERRRIEERRDREIAELREEAEDGGGC